MHEKELKIEARHGLVLAMILIAAISRLISPPILGPQLNFAPVGAISLFSGAYFASPAAALLVPLAAVFIGDQIVNAVYLPEYTMFYLGWYWQYGAYLLIAGIGYLLRGRISPVSVLSASLSSSLLFFVVSNFGVWFSLNMYPHTWEGLLLSYTMALPFLKGTLFGDLFYVTLMFGSYEFMVRRVFSRTQAVQAG